MRGLWERWLWSNTCKAKPRSRHIRRWDEPEHGSSNGSIDTDLGILNGIKDKPKTPHGHPREIPPEMKKLVRNIRIDLEEHPYAQIGNSAIKWESRKLGVTSPLIGQSMES